MIIFFHPLSANKLVNPMPIRCSAWFDFSDVSTVRRKHDVELESVWLAFTVLKTFFRLWWRHLTTLAAGATLMMLQRSLSNMTIFVRKPAISSQLLRSRVLLNPGVLHCRRYLWKKFQQLCPQRFTYNFSRNWMPILTITTRNPVLAVCLFVMAMLHCV